MSLSVHLLRAPGEKALAHLESLLDPEVQLTLGPDLPPAPEYEILVAGRPQRQHLEASAALRALIIPWSGLPETTRALLQDFSDVALHNLHHNAIPVAEMAVTLMLAAAKRIVPRDRALRAHDWRPRYRPSPTLLLEGKTALILGYGAIGRHVARMCRGLGMGVLAIRRHPDRTPAPTSVEVYAPSALDRCLAQANVLIICLPLTPETTELVGARELALLPSDAILINVGRGPIVEQAALYRALRQGDLRAAGLDVWYNYPSDEKARSHTPPSDFPFHALDNVVMSPHVAGGSAETERRRMSHLAVLLNAAARGERIPNQVDLKAGY